MSYLYLRSIPAAYFSSIGPFPNVHRLGQIGDSRGAGADVDQAIRHVKAKMEHHLDRYNKLFARAGRTNDGTAARGEVKRHSWSGRMKWIFSKALKLHMNPRLECP